MSGDCIVWSGESNMPEVDIKQCRVDIQKCTYMSGEELSRSHVDIKPSDQSVTNIRYPDRYPVNYHPSIRFRILPHQPDLNRDHGSVFALYIWTTVLSPVCM